MKTKKIQKWTSFVSGCICSSVNLLSLCNSTWQVWVQVFKWNNLFRYNLVVLPHKHLLNSRRASLVALCLWITSVIVCMPYGWYMDVVELNGLCGEVSRMNNDNIFDSSIARKNGHYLKLEKDMPLRFFFFNSCFLLQSWLSVTTQYFPDYVNGISALVLLK